MKNNLQNLAAMLISQKNLLLTGHIDADGDAVGSLLGLYQAFNGAAKGWQIVLDAPLEAYLRFLPLSEIIKTPENDLSKIHALLLVDCNNKQRAGGEWLIHLTEGLPCYVLDHHQIGGQAEGEIVVIEPKAAATSELVGELIELSGLNFDNISASCLYTGIAFDTSCFRNLNTTSQSHLWAQKFLAFKIDLEQIHMNLFQNRSLQNMQLLAEALLSIEQYADGQAAVFTVTAAIKDKYEANHGDCSSITTYLLSIQNVKIGVLFEETEKNIRVSLRCRRGFDVRCIAEQFSGGGHVLAAGCCLEKPLHQAKASVILAVITHIVNINGE
ncbi:MAG: DHHA1 domain-containing protein [Clostridia bacterium]|nr:DHHA1 domain-containing protein [Clostridia bacterium]